MRANLTTVDPTAGYLAGGEPVRRPQDEPAPAQGLLDEIATAVSLNQPARLAFLLDRFVSGVRRVCPPRPGTRRPERGSLGQVLGQLLQVERALREEESTVASAGAWRDVSGAYSALGMHAKAMGAAHHASRVGLAAGQPEEAGACLVGRVRSAVAADQRGDADGAVRDLRNLLVHARRLEDLTAPRDLAYLRYAVHRLAALGHPVTVDVTPVADPGDPTIRPLNTLIEVCDAIAADRPGRAVGLLDALAPAPEVLGEAEVPRLRSLALRAAGDQSGALAAERAAHRATRAHDQRLVDWLTAAVSATMERDWLRDSADHYRLQARSAVQLGPTPAGWAVTPDVRHRPVPAP
ncbi:hypothetical protein AB0M43_02155 [Longispora sp. NPDC051575]|uniref:hypothetical protein n=1 Tax=Longispora sp. NPDC051575 TaxID=3154943 RepID=UPI0034147578